VTYNKLLAEYRSASAAYKKESAVVKKASSELAKAKISVKRSCKECSICGEKCKDEDLKVMDAKGRCSKPDLMWKLSKAEDRTPIERSLK
jgi:hypothetical protein